MDNQQLDDQGLLDNGQYARVGKKTYRRPSVHVYGTLSQITQASNVPAGSLDPNANPSSPSGQQNGNRT